jgi:uncharacterized protein YjbI with pentapeptide repeats
MTESVRVDDSPEALQRLQTLIAEHARWVDSGGGEGARAQFVKSDLSGLDLSDAALTGAVFREAKLRGTRLPGASLNLASFHECDFTGADLTGAQLRGVRFDQCNLEAARFCGADLGVETVRLSATKSAEHASIVMGCRVVKADFTGANATSLQVKETDLAKAVTDRGFLDGLAKQNGDGQGQRTPG